VCCHLWISAFISGCMCKAHGNGPGVTINVQLSVSIQWSTELLWVQMFRENLSMLIAPKHKVVSLYIYVCIYIHKPNDLGCGSEDVDGDCGDGRCGERDCGDRGCGARGCVDRGGGSSV